MNVLHVIANPRPAETSSSKKLAFEFFAALTEKNPDVVVNNVDLYQNKPPYVSAEALNYFWGPVANPAYIPSKAEETAANFSNNNAQALIDADVLVLTLPVWLNSMPAILKAWLDQVIVPGKMFEFGAEGLVPTHHLRTVVLLVSSDQVYKENDVRDGLTPAIRAIFAYIGVEDIQIAWADGQDASRHFDSNERREMAIEAAKEIAEEIAELP
ncbi:MAG: NAD(P)H-dependent oxidoreductase [Kiritimatiellae bacterium]|jgi:FMN-dependent NADH-azoreductase|nr:NAD(P)H-dependent oxidoreductase [Kiritimatiellia bacterium]HOU20727.1 NAD(P)H-dependent oxidoreductase [Kiritimatiellia bacterium]HPC20732.1 NAD(P)H-dependent oxidoreductase [Kiritimatiellia bacterium]HQN79509.1 NAD(P)H-dependent oxidoreductase [Kiritimatiellia bacterium]HQQ61310.1 NAD(P)H-dependent oxidoreductase [Kiritimatiellia bacterium]